MPGQKESKEDAMVITPKKHKADTDGTLADCESPAKKQKTTDIKVDSPTSAGITEKKEVTTPVHGKQTVIAPVLASAEPDAKLLKLAVNTNGKETAAFRNYVNSSRQQSVERLYKAQHSLQTVEHVNAMHAKYNQLKLCRMGLWECLEYLDTFVDDSDPDTENSQMQHALQTAEAIRAQYPSEEHDWFALIGLIHDLGKLIAPKGGEPQWTTVGDTFPVGCAPSAKNVFSQFFDANPDTKNPAYNTELGVYRANCGLKNVQMSYGHDEYLYQVATRNGTTLPTAALYIIRYHSFYPWHKEGAYKHLMDKEDEVNLRWVQAFQKFDLYSKAHIKADPKVLRPYYQGLIEKYFPANKGVLNW